MSQTDKLHREPMSARRLYLIKGKARGRKGWQLSSSGKVEHIELPQVLTRQCWLYRVAASTFKTDGFDRMRFERCSSALRPKLLVYQRLNWDKLCMHLKKFLSPTIPSSQATLSASRSHAT